MNEWKMMNDVKTPEEWKMRLKKRVSEGAKTKIYHSRKRLVLLGGLCLLLVSGSVSLAHVWKHKREINQQLQEQFEEEWYMGAQYSKVEFDYEEDMQVLDSVKDEQGGVTISVDAAYADGYYLTLYYTVRGKTGTLHGEQLPGLQIVAVDGRDCRGGNSQSLCFLTDDGIYYGYTYVPIAEWVDGLNLTEQKDTVTIQCQAGDQIPFEETYVGRPNTYTYTLEFDVQIDTRHLAKERFVVAGTEALVEVIRHSQGLSIVEKGFDGYWMPLLHGEDGKRIEPIEARPDQARTDIYYVEFSVNSANVLRGTKYRMTLKPEMDKSGWAEVEIEIP